MIDTAELPADIISRVSIDSMAGLITVRFGRRMGGSPCQGITGSNPRSRRQPKSFRLRNLTILTATNKCCRLQVMSQVGSESRARHPARDRPVPIEASRITGIKSLMHELIYVRVASVGGAVRAGRPGKPDPKREALSTSAELASVGARDSVSTTRTRDPDQTETSPGSGVLTQRHGQEASRDCRERSGDVTLGRRRIWVEWGRGGRPGRADHQGGHSGGAGRGGIRRSTRSRRRCSRWSTTTG